MSVQILSFRKNIGGFNWVSDSDDDMMLVEIKTLREINNEKQNHLIQNHQITQEQHIFTQNNIIETKQNPNIQIDMQFTTPQRKKHEFYNQNQMNSTISTKKDCREEEHELNETIIENEEPPKSNKKQITVVDNQIETATLYSTYKNLYQSAKEINNDLKQKKRELLKKLEKNKEIYENKYKNQSMSNHKFVAELQSARFDLEHKVEASEKKLRELEEKKDENENYVKTMEIRKNIKETRESFTKVNVSLNVLGKAMLNTILNDDDFIAVCDGNPFVGSLGAKYKELVDTIKVNFLQKQDEDFKISASNDFYPVNF